MYASQAKADAHQAEMQERMDANTKAMQENQAKSDADRRADKEEMLAAIKANKEMTASMDAKIGSMHDELKNTIEEKMKNAMQSMQAALKAPSRK
jgi:3-dehydroquinate dehydratase